MLYKQFKKYIETVLTFYEITTSISTYLIDILATAYTLEDNGFFNFFVTSSNYFKETTAKSNNKSIYTIKRVFQLLKENGLFKSVHKGTYSFDPFIFGPGNYDMIDSFSANFDFLNNKIKTSFILKKDYIKNDSILAYIQIEKYERLSKFFEKN